MNTLQFATKILKPSISANSINKVLQNFINENPEGFASGEDLYEEVICIPAPAIGKLLKLKVDAENDRYVSLERKVVKFFMDHYGLESPV